MKNKYKIIKFIFALIYSTACFSQLSNLSDNPINQSAFIPSLNNNGFFINSNNSNDKIKKVFLFKDFNNDAVILTSNSKDFKIKNINIDLVENCFVSSFKKDSLYSYRNLNKVKINNRNFIIENKKVLEIISSGKKIEFRVKYFSEKKDKLINQLNGNVIRPEKYIIKKRYFLIDLITNNTFTITKINKKIILKHLQSNKKVLNYAKVQKLSFKKLEELKIILDFYNEL